MVGAGVPIGEIGSAHLFEGAHAAPRGVEKADERESPFECAAVRGEFLAHTAAPTPRAAPHGEIARTDNHLAAIELEDAFDSRLRPEVGQLPRIVIGAFASEPTEFTKRAGVCQEVQPFADGELAVEVLAGDTLGAAHLEGEFAPPLEFFNFRAPGHCYGSFSISRA